MDSAQALAVAFVFISNVLVVAGLGWVIYHIHQATEQMQARLTSASDDLTEVGRGLRGLGTGVDRLVERMSSAERQATAMLKVTADSVADMDTRLQQALRTTLNDLAENGDLMDSALLQDLRRLVASLDQVLPGAANVWADNHRQELEQVMAQSEVLMTENEQLTGRVHDLREQLDGLRSVQRAQQAADREIDSLQRALTQQQQLAERLRNDAREAAHRAGEADARALQRKAESELSRADAEQQALLAKQAEQRVSQLDDELTALRQTHDRLQAEHARQRDQLERLSVEKAFIEDKFLGLDADETATAGS